MTEQAAEPKPYWRRPPMFWITRQIARRMVRNEPWLNMMHRIAAGQGHPLKTFVEAGKLRHGRVNLGKVARNYLAQRFAPPKPAQAAS